MPHLVRKEKNWVKVNDFFAIIAFYLSGHMKENYGDYLHGRNLCDRVYSKLEFEKYLDFGWLGISTEMSVG